VARKKKITKDILISEEKAELEEMCKNVALENKPIIQRLINRASYMLVSLEQMEKDLNDNGWYEYFTQSEKTDPYERERPVARQYISLSKNYQSNMKLLNDLLTKETKVESDELIAFISGTKK